MQNYKFIHKIRSFGLPPHHSITTFLNIKSQVQFHTHFISLDMQQQVGSNTAWPRPPTSPFPTSPRYRPPTPVPSSPSQQDISSSLSICSSNNPLNTAFINDSSHLLLSDSQSENSDILSISSISVPRKEKRYPHIVELEDDDTPEETQWPQKASEGKKKDRKRKRPHIEEKEIEEKQARKSKKIEKLKLLANYLIAKKSNPWFTTHPSQPTNPTYLPCKHTPFSSPSEDQDLYNLLQALHPQNQNPPPNRNPQ